MTGTKAVVVACDIVTPYGWGIDSCWNGLLSKKTAIGRFDRFPTESFLAQNAAVVPGLTYGQDESIVMKMLKPLLQKNIASIPEDAFPVLATTAGEIDKLERHVLHETTDAESSRPDKLLEKISLLCRLNSPGIVVSAACASSSIAVAQAAGMIISGETDCVMVVACDSVSEFVFAGFSSLMALDKDMAKPFDRDRNGLSLGEASGFLLLMSESRASRENRPVIGEIAGWGLTNDANHMTGPSRDGNGLAMAIRKALKSANVSKKDIGCLSAHGTGTIYNDSMEMKALRTVFGNHKVPVYSIKGGTGHTLGAAGLLEIVIAFQSLNKKIVPPTVNLCNTDNDASGWVSSEPLTLNGSVTISTNSGFGGVNCAVVLKKW